MGSGPEPPRCPAPRGATSGRLPRDRGRGRSEDPRTVAGMVFVADEGSMFDAPIELLWKYIFSSEAHDASHTTTRRPRFEKVSEVTFLYGSERLLRGQWGPDRLRISMFPPISIDTEWLEGVLAGSKLVYVYAPGATGPGSTSTASSPPRPSRRRGSRGSPESSSTASSARTRRRSESSSSDRSDPAPPSRTERRARTPGGPATRTDRSGGNATIRAVGYRGLVPSSRPRPVLSPWGTNRGWRPADRIAASRSARETRSPRSTSSRCRMPRSRSATR